MLKRVLVIIGIVVVITAAGAGIFAATRISAFDESLAKAYDVPLPPLVASTDPAVIARGKHLAESIGGCLACHGADLASGKIEAMGPLGRLQAPNLTRGKNGVGGAYGDAEMARVIQHGVRRDGTGVRFMPAGDFAWWPDDDVIAVISYLRTFPPKDTEPNVMEIGALGKVLDRLDVVPLDSARRIDHAHMPKAPAPAPTKEYGAFVGKLCTGCHGTTLAGGPIPGAPPELPVPLNLTPHETGLKSWSYEDFDKLMTQAIRKNGQALNPFMPIETMKNFNDTEKRALWAYLASVQPKPFGER